MRIGSEILASRDADAVFFRKVENAKKAQFFLERREANAENEKD